VIFSEKAKGREIIARTSDVMPLSVTDERNHISIEIADMEIRSAPGLLGRRLRKRRASLCEFSEQALGVGDLDPGQDQGRLARGEFGEVWLMNAA